MPRAKWPLRQSHTSLQNGYPWHSTNLFQNSSGTVREWNCSWCQCIWILGEGVWLLVNPMLFQHVVIIWKMALSGAKERKELSFQVTGKMKLGHLLVTHCLDLNGYVSVFISLNGYIPHSVIVVQNGSESSSDKSSAAVTIFLLSIQAWVTVQLGWLTCLLPYIFD